MASSNRHWPSLFKSKPCSAHQWQHEISHSPFLSSSTCQKPFANSVAACEERTPEPKPRWNPKPEQIRILEAIFNSGMVNPPRDEIRRIRAQLQEFGQVGDANVFYWFQNRKSRSKHKQRQVSSGGAVSSRPVTRPSAARLPPPQHTSSSTSSSSDPSSGGSEKTTTTAFSVAVTASSTASPTTSINQACFPHVPSQFTFASQLPPSANGYYNFSDLMSVVGGTPPLPPPEQQVNSASWVELLGQEGSKSTPFVVPYIATPTLAQVTTTTTTTTTKTENSSVTIITSPLVATACVASPINEIQGLERALGLGAGNIVAEGEGTASPPPPEMTKTTAPATAVVFINDVAFEVSPSRFNVREAFGQEAVLLHSSGLPVLSDEWGTTLYPLQHGASYYLV